MSRWPALTVDERFWAKVRKSDTCWEWQAALRSGYGVFWDGERITGSHRFAYESTVGPIPESLHLDHICHNRRCVNPEHLRPVTVKQNIENLAGPRVDNTSGYRGVTWDKKRNCWMAQVHHQGRCFHAGYFASREEAAVAAADKRNELFTHNDKDRNAA